MVSGEIEEVEVERRRDVPLLEVAGYRSGNHLVAKVGRRGRKWIRVTRGEYIGRLSEEGGEEQQE